MASPAKAAAMEALRDRIRGCLVGAVLGDCLGAPVECRHWDGIPTHQVDKQYEKYFSDSPSKVYKYTDDTAMARCLLEISFKKYGGHDKSLSNC